MAEPIRVEAAFADDEYKTMFFETGKLAGLAGGSVLVGMGGTRVLLTATAAPNPREGADFFPLTVDIEEKMYAAGKIPGSFFRREARAGEAAILASTGRCGRRSPTASATRSTSWARCWVPTRRTPTTSWPSTRPPRRS
jgi:hypothetical protein